MRAKYGGYWEFGCEEFADAAVFEYRFRARGLRTPRSRRGARVEIKSVMGRSGITTVHRVWYCLWFGWRGPFDSGVQRTIEPGHVRVFEPEKKMMDQ